MLRCFGTLRQLDYPSIHATCAAVLPLLGQFKAQDLANTVWSLGVLSAHGEPVLSGLAEATLQEIDRFAPQGSANVA